MGVMGVGMRTITRQIGLGMIQQINNVCPECRGPGMPLLFHLCVSSYKMCFAWSGEIISERDKCPSCRANKVVQEKKVLHVYIEKGMQHGQKNVFHGEADQAVISIHLFHVVIRWSIELLIIALATINIGYAMAPFMLQHDTMIGDIVFILQVKEHARFKRKHDDLFIEHTISLTEALCEFQFISIHLECRQLLMKSNSWEINKLGVFPLLESRFFILTPKSTLVCRFFWIWIL